MGCCNARRGLIAGAALGALVALLGGVLIPVGEMIIKKTVEKVRSSGEERVGEGNPSRKQPDSDLFKCARVCVCV